MERGKRDRETRPAARGADGENEKGRPQKRSGAAEHGSCAAKSRCSGNGLFWLKHTGLRCGYAL